MMIVGYLLHVGMRKVIAESCRTAVQLQRAAGVAATIHELAEILHPLLIRCSSPLVPDGRKLLSGWMDGGGAAPSDDEDE